MSCPECFSGVGDSHLKDCATGWRYRYHELYATWSQEAVKRRKAERKFFYLERRYFVLTETLKKAMLILAKALNERP